MSFIIMFAPHHSIGIPLRRLGYVCMHEANKPFKLHQSKMLNSVGDSTCWDLKIENLKQSSTVIIYLISLVFAYFARETNLTYFAG